MRTSNNNCYRSTPRHRAWWTTAAVLLICASSAALAEPASQLPLRTNWAHFNALRSVDNLKLGATYRVFQDHSGFIWFGTDNGVIRYDGTRAVVYRHKVGDPSTLAADLVRGMAQDTEGRIWFGTYGGGLDLYNPKTDSFTLYSHHDNVGTSISSNYIWSLAAGRKGTVWIGTFDRGLDHFDPDTGKFTHYQHDDTDPSSISSNRVNSIYVDHSGRLWVATEHGVDLWLGDHRGFRHFGNGSLRPGKSSLPLHTWSVAEDDDQHIWILSNSHLYILSTDLTSSREIRLIPDPNNPSPTQADVFRKLTLDSAGNAWIASMNGLYEIPKNGAFANEFRHFAWNSYSIVNNQVWDVMQDRTGLMWLATWEGSNTLDSRAMLFNFITSTPETPGLGDVSGYWIAMGNDHDAWTAGRNAVEEVDINQNKIVRTIKAGGKDGRSLTTGNVNILLRTAGGHIWLGTSRGGLDRLDPGDGAVSHFGRGSNFHDGIASSEVSTLAQTTPGKLWVGTLEHGLFEIDTKTGDRLPRWWDDALDGALHMDGIQALGADPQGRIWLTDRKALYVLDPGRKTVTNIPLPKNDDPQRTGAEIVYSWMMPDGFMVSTTNDIVSIPIAEDGSIGEAHEIGAPFKSRNTSALSATEDRQHNIWFGTYNGIYRRDQQTGKYVHFGEAQGLPINTVYAIKTLPNGHILALGDTGMALFDPAALNATPYPAHPQVTSIRAYRGNQVSDLLAWGAGLTIPPDQSTTTLHFSLFDYHDAHALNYRYRMLGLDDNWIDSGNTNTATYTNLSPGHYTFEVTGANADGTWAKKPYRLAVTVLPPWWRTWWAYLLYTLALIGLVASYVLRQRRKLEHERAISAQLREADALKTEFVEKLKQEVASATRDLRDALEAMRIKNVELDEANRRSIDASRIKSEFLSNMSHEIRTPMSGILGFLELLERTRLNPDQSGYLDAIKHSADSLIGIIDDILDLSRIEAGKLSLDETGFTPRQMLESAVELLAPIAYDKDLELAFICDIPPDVMLRGDPQRLRQVVVNLLGNAVKYTHEGTITLSAALEKESETGASLRIAVTDTGIGIAPELQQDLFQAFNRGSIDVTRRYRGTGLGLSICKMLVDAMHGNIRLHSTPGIGSTFEITVDLPVEHRISEVPVSRPLGGKRAIIYDANPVARHALTSILTSLGMQPEEAESPAALTAAISGKTNGGYDLILIGLGTDVESDLEAVAGTLASRPTGMPALTLVSTMRHVLLREIADALGVDARPKTLRLTRLEEVICALLDIKPSETHARLAPANGEAAAESGTLLQGLHILVTDDNRINRSLLVKMLSQAGAEVDECVDGRDAITHAQNTRYDAILMDVHMPGLSGIEVTQELRRRDTEAAIIGVSANALPETRSAAVEAGIDDYLVKPVREVALIESILRCVDLRRDRSSGR